MRRNIIIVNDIGALVIVEACVLGNYGVHAAIEKDGYSISHVPSGLRLHRRSIRSLAIAIRIAELCYERFGDISDSGSTDRDEEIFDWCDELQRRTTYERQEIEDFPAQTFGC